MPSLSQSLLVRLAFRSPWYQDAIQSCLDMLEKWAFGNLMKFNRAKCKVLHLHWGNPCYQYSCGLKELSPAEMDFGGAGG